jgi:hypothetical protein
MPTQVFLQEMEGKPFWDTLYNSQKTTVFGRVSLFLEQFRMAYGRNWCTGVVLWPFPWIVYHFPSSHGYVLWKVNQVWTCAR